MHAQQAEGIVIIHSQRVGSVILMIASSCLTLCFRPAFAISLGEVSVRSHLGQVLRAQLPVSGAADDINPGCIKPKIESMDGELVDIPRVEFLSSGGTAKSFNVSFVSRKIIKEPAIKLLVANVCGSSIQREYSILLDFPDTRGTSAENASAQAPALVLNRTAPGSAERVPNLDEAGLSDLASFDELPVRPASKIYKTKAKLSAGNVVNDSVDERGNPVKMGSSAIAATAAKDVLKIDNSDLVSNGGLKMTPLMTLPSLTESAAGNVDQQRALENRLAQAQFAAMLRGEDALSAAASAAINKNAQQKNKVMEAELAQLREQVKRQTNSAPPGFMLLSINGFLLAFALLLGLIGVIFLAIKRSQKMKEKIWWDAQAEQTEQKDKVVNAADSLEAGVDKGDFDPGLLNESLSQSLNQPMTKKSAQETPDEKNAQPSFEKITAFKPLHKEMELLDLDDTDSGTFHYPASRSKSIQIEEISDITQEVEFWISVNDPKRAIDILEPQSKDINQLSPITWLYLLDLYRSVGDEYKYAELRQRFLRKFNASIPGFSDIVDPKAAHSLDDFPHIIAKCCHLWTTDKIIPYLELLIIDDREGERTGFALSVYRDILMLLSIAIELERSKQPSKYESGVVNAKFE